MEYVYFDTIKCLDPPSSILMHLSYVTVVCVSVMVKLASLCPTDAPHKENLHILALNDFEGELFVYRQFYLLVNLYFSC